jgi:hypothetical protein
MKVGQINPIQPKIGQINTKRPKIGQVVISENVNKPKLLNLNK